MMMPHKCLKIHKIQFFAHVEICRKISILKIIAKCIYDIAFCVLFQIRKKFYISLHADFVDLVDLEVILS